MNKTYESIRRIEEQRSAIRRVIVAPSDVQQPPVRQVIQVQTNDFNRDVEEARMPLLVQQNPAPPIKRLPLLSSSVKKPRKIKSKTNLYINTGFPLLHAPYPDIRKNKRARRSCRNSNCSDPSCKGGINRNYCVNPLPERLECSVS